MNSKSGKDPEKSGRKTIFAIIATVLAVLFVLYWYVGFPKIPGTTSFDGVQVSIIPENRTIIKGQEFFADIVIEPGIRPVSAVQFSLFFNNSMLSIKNVQEGEFLKINHTQTYFSPGKINNTGGKLLNVYGAMMKPGGNTTVSNTFARITLSSMASGNSSIDLGDVIISGPDSEKYPVKVVNGSVEVRE